MPKITRQEPPRQITAAPVSGLLSTATPVTTLRETSVKICIYGRNRVGKSSLAAELPKPLLFVSCEPALHGGVQSIANMKDVTLIHVEPYNGKGMSGREKVEGIGRELMSDTYYKTVVLKTATSLQDLILEEMKIEFGNLPLSGRGSKDTYQLRASKLHDAMRPYIDLKHCHLIVLAQEKDHNPPVGEGGFPDLKAKLLQTMQQSSFMAPALGAANAQWLQDACGYIIQMYEDELTQEISIPQMDMEGKPLPPAIQRVGTGIRQRHLRLQYHPNFAAGGKWQFDRNVPEFVTAPTPKELYVAMVQYIPSLKV